MDNYRQGPRLSVAGRWLSRSWGRLESWRRLAGFLDLKRRV